ncbi:MAG: hypothetical protein E6G57_00830 [Actinobacteria bacterium]|nr:MAG: hypothetical protein E6G57_00830 [Actinomycetota bacterium]
MAGTALALLLAPSPAYAHLGHCTNAEAASTIAVSGLLAVLLFRPWKKVSSLSAKITRLALPAVLAIAVTATGCGGSKTSTSSSQHPASPVRIQITQPTPNQTTGPDVTLVVNLIGGKVVPAAQTTVKGSVPTDQGHIHVSLDGTLVNMAYSTTQDLHGLKPGQHTLTAEFVAIDHLPFQNRPTAAVIFMVQ